MKSATLEGLLGKISKGEIQPVYLVSGDLVLAEPQARRLAKALAEKAGCTVESYRHPAGLGSLLEDLRTYSLFSTAKVVLVIDAAILADRNSAAELVDQAAEVLPLGDVETLDEECYCRPYHVRNRRQSIFKTMAKD